MKSALIFLHGDLSDISPIKPYIELVDLLIAADGGAEYALKSGVTPHIVIGDLDSISPETKALLENKTTWQIYPREKDFTDAELAIQYALEKTATTVYIVGFLGRRLDHMLANLAYLSTIPAHVVLIEGSQRLSFIKKSASIIGKKDDEVSLIPLLTDCLDVTTAGLSYPLDHELLPYGTTRGISNVMLAEKATVTISSGTLLCIQTIK
ncbi:thiamine diphosphokinase [soil metagenome]